MNLDACEYGFYELLNRIWREINQTIHPSFELSELANIDLTLAEYENRCLNFWIGKMLRVPAWVRFRIPLTRYFILELAKGNESAVLSYKFKIAAYRRKIKPTLFTKLVF